MKKFLISILLCLFTIIMANAQEPFRVPVPSKITTLTPEEIKQMDEITGLSSSSNNYFSQFEEYNGLKPDKNGYVEIGYKFYLKVTSIEKLSNEVYGYWIKSLNPGTWKPYNGKKIWYAMTYEKMHCRSKTIDYYDEINYDLKGNVLYRLDEYSYSNKIIPDTIGEALYDYICH